MLRIAREMQGFTIRATDGDLGHVDQSFFDDEKWTIRYLVVNTGNWLSGRKVLISPMAISEANWIKQRVQVNLTRQQIKNSPDIDTDQPVSRQQEVGYASYYGWPSYWEGAGLWGTFMYPAALVPPAGTQPQAYEGAPVEEKPEGDRHLRSTTEVAGYTVEARDGEIGRVVDFIVDDETWAIRYLVVETGTWWSGKKVLVPPDWIDGVSWPEARVTVDLDRATIKNGPEWDPNVPISREFEERLYGYYHRPSYWSRRAA